MQQRKSLTDILRNGNAQALRDAWTRTEAADDHAPLPAGEYVCQISSGELFTSRTHGTPGYKLTFRISEGDHAGRLVWHDLWLTPAALPMTKRDLAKLGITDPEQLEAPLPRGIRCTVKVTLRMGDDGTAFNRVKTFDVVGIDPPDPDPFAPDAGTAQADGPSDATPF